jgi:hypothetical protein
MRPVAAVDLDGTIAEYEGWVGEDVIGDPIPGAIEFLLNLKHRGFDIVIFTARAGTELGINAIWKWLQDHKLNQLVEEVTNVKQYRFSVMIDDRAIPFAEGQDGGYEPIIRWACMRCGVKTDDEASPSGG